MEVAKVLFAQAGLLVDFYGVEGEGGGGRVGGGEGGEDGRGGFAGAAVGGGEEVEGVGGAEEGAEFAAGFFGLGRCTLVKEAWEGRKTGGLPVSSLRG